MRIQHNLLAMNSQRNLVMNGNASAKAIEKLSSGLRINKAGDDAAGLAISEKMRSQIRGLNMASRNAQDAISLVQTAEGATSEVHSILQRVRELSVQSANGTNTTEDRSAIQNEVSQLVSEVDRIAETTEFNGMKILDGTVESTSPVSQEVVDILTAKIPAYLDDAMDQIEANFLAISTPSGKRNLSIEYYYDDVTKTGASMGTDDRGASLTLRVNLAGVTDSAGNLIAEESLDTLIAHEVMHAYEFTNMDFSTDNNFDVDENWFLEGLAMAIQGGNNFPHQDAPAPAHKIDLTNPFDGDYKAAYEAVKVLHEVTDGGIDAIITQLELGDNLDQAMANTTQDFVGELNGATNQSDFGNMDDFVTWFNDDDGGHVITYLTGSDDFDLNIGSGAIDDGDDQGSHSLKDLGATIANDEEDSKATDSFNISFVNPNIYVADSYQSLEMQIGANKNQSMSIRLENVTAVNLGIDEVDVSTGDGAKTAIDTLDDAIGKVSVMRGRYGSLQNRLESAIKSLDNSAENLQAAESRIRDVDMAKEMMTFSKLNILTQAAQSMLAQANQAPQGVLQLLR